MGGGNFPKIFQKFKCPRGCPGGMLKLRFDWYINDEKLTLKTIVDLGLVKYRQIWGTQTLMSWTNKCLDAPDLSVFHEPPIYC